MRHEPAAPWPPSAGQRPQPAIYSTYFGFDPATATGYPDGTTIVRDADGFDLALHSVADPAPPVGFLHFGFRVAEPDQVHALRERMESDNVSIVERDDEPDLVSF